MKKILIVDDHTIFRQALIAAIHGYTEPGAFACVEASTADQTLTLFAEQQYDLVILDISLPITSGLELLPELKLRHPAVPVLMLSMHPEEEYALLALKFGASGYLSKREAVDELLTAITSLLNGHRYLSGSFSTQLLDQLLNPESRQAVALRPRLSKRETEVLKRMTAGQCLKDIAIELGLSIKTVSTYKTRMFEKLGCKNNADLFTYALRHPVC